MEKLGILDSRTAEQWEEHYKTVEALDYNCVDLRKIRIADLGGRMHVAVGKIDLVVLS